MNQKIKDILFWIFCIIEFITFFKTFNVTLVDNIPIGDTIFNGAFNIFSFLFIISIIGIEYLIYSKNNIK